MTAEQFNGPFKVFEGPDFGESFYTVPGTVVLLKDDDQVVKSIMYRCPCGNGSPVCGNVRLPVNRGANYKKPTWSYTVDEEGLITISPSIDQSTTPGCGSHYTIQNGMVEWL